MKTVGPTHADPLDGWDEHVEGLFAEDGDDEEHLKVDFDDGFSDDGCWEECAEWDAEMSACNAC